MSIFTRTVLAAALLAAAPLASAATLVSDDMTVSITIENSCTVVAEDLSFGTNSTLATAITSTAAVTVDCTSQGPIAVSFSAGASGDAAARTMASGAATIDYQLYRDAAHTEVLGDGANGTVVFGGGLVVSDGGAQIFTVHGRVPVQGPKPVGAYTDLIVATLAY